MNDYIELTLVPEKCIFSNPETDYYIYACSTDSTEVELNSYNNISVKGKMQRLDLGVDYKAQIIESERHKQYGVSYQVLSIFQDIPDTVENQKNYLMAILTESQVDEIYKTYSNGEDIIKLFKNKQFDWEKVKGFGKITYNRVRDKILENLEHKLLFGELGKYGITYDTIQKIINEFGSAQLAMQKISENAYILTRIPNIGFKKADAVALNMVRHEIKEKLKRGEISEEKSDILNKQAFESPFRIHAGIKHVILQEQGSGHTYINKNKLIKNGIELLQINTDLIKSQIGFCDGLHITEDERIALEDTYLAELYFSDRIKKMLNNSNVLDFDVEKFIAKMESKYSDILKDGLSDHQKQFFHNIKENSVNLLVGYAGTGKSMLQKLLIDLLEWIGLTYTLLSPTGKAAKVLSKYTGRKATTIHKRIGFGQGKKKDEMHEIDEDFIVIDENSMLDVFVGSSILSRIKNPNSRILFIGDPFQIGSVGCGNLLHDMLESKIIPTTKLDKVFRQSDGGILDIASRVRLGEKFIENDFRGKKKFGNNLIIHSANQEFMVDGYNHYYKLLLNNSIPQEIMVLSPTKKGNLGTIAVNKDIQNLVNSIGQNKKEVEFGNDNTLRVDDFIINVKNTYDVLDVDGKQTEIVNGDMGIVSDIVTDWKPEKNKESEEKEANEEDKNGIYVNFDFSTVKISLSDKFQLLHGWCLTIHKSQGSAAKSTIVIADKSHKWQLNANLLYTAITRSEEKCVILCQADVINSAMRKFENLRRNTFMQEMLVGSLKIN